MGAVKQLIDEKLLRTFIPLNALGLDKIHELAGKSTVEKVAAGRILFRQGDKDKRTLYLLAGEVELSAEDRSPHVIRAGSPQASHPLAPHQPRPVTARAKTSTTLLVIDPDLLDVLLSWNQPGGYEVTEIPSDSDTDWLTRFLQAHTTLKLPADNIQALLQRLEELPVKAGSVVIRQNDNDQHYYIIKQGRCSVSRRASTDAEDITLAELTAGDGFGEEALITHGRRNATITMIEDGVLMRLTRRDFITYLSDPLLHRVPYADAMSMLQEGAVLLDVRTPDEFERDGVGINIPLPLLRIKAAGLDKQRTYVLCCDNGSRSAAAAFLLIQQGMNACILDGGLNKLPAHSLKDKPQEASAAPAMSSGADVVNLNAVKAQHNKTRPAAAKKTDTDTVSAAAQVRRAETAEAARAASERETARLQAELEATRAAAEQEIARLRTEMEAMRVAAEAVRVDTERMAARLMADIATARQGETEARKHAEEQVRRAEQELVLLKAELSTAHATAAQTATRSATAEAARLEAEREVARLKEEAQVARRNRVDADKRAEEYARRAQEAETARAAAEQEIARLQAEIEAARAAAVQVTNQSVSLEAIRSETERERAHLKAQIDDLHQQCTRADQHIHEQTRRTETAETVRAAAEQAAARLKIELDTARAEVVRIAGKIAATETAHAQAQREILQLKTELESLRSQPKAQIPAPAVAPPSAVEPVQETPRAKTAAGAAPGGTAAAATPTTSPPDDDLQSLGAIQAIYAAFRMDMQTESSRSKTSRRRAAAAQNAAATKAQPHRGAPVKPARPAEETAAETTPTTPQTQTPKPVQAEREVPTEAVAPGPVSAPQATAEPRARNADQPPDSEQAESNRLLKKRPLPLLVGGEAGSSRMDLTSIRAAERAHTILVRPGGNEGEGAKGVFQPTASVGELAPAVLAAPDEHEHPAAELPAAQLPAIVNPPPPALPGQPVTDEFVIETSDVPEDAKLEIHAQRNPPAEPSVDVPIHPPGPAATTYERSAVFSGLNAHGRLRLIAIAASAALIIGLGTAFYRLGAAGARQTGVHATAHPVPAMVIPKAGSVMRPR